MAGVEVHWGTGPDSGLPIMCFFRIHLQRDTASKQMVGVVTAAPEPYSEPPHVMGFGVGLIYYFFIRRPD